MEAGKAGNDKIWIVFTIFFRVGKLRQVIFPGCCHNEIIVEGKNIFYYDINLGVRTF